MAATRLSSSRAAPSVPLVMVMVFSPTSLAAATGSTFTFSAADFTASRTSFSVISPLAPSSITVPSASLTEAGTAYFFSAAGATSFFGVSFPCSVFVDGSSLLEAGDGAICLKNTS